MFESLAQLNSFIVGCEKCSRLVEYRRRVAQTKTKRFSDWTYWGKPLPGFGDKDAEILVVGLAPAAHGGNRTGRMFTGDSSGNTLMGSLYRVGLASKPTSTDRWDGLKLWHVYITAVLRCVPPGNRPLRTELENCSIYLKWELELLKSLKVIVALGSIAYDSCIRLLGFQKKKFAHGLILSRGDLYLVSSYHPSRRNTQTGLLKQEMLDNVFATAKRLSGL
ncbi:MAG: uracil-DNA glycosylase [Thermoprotei archaeon]